MARAGLASCAALPLPLAALAAVIGHLLFSAGLSAGLLPHGCARCVRCLGQCHLPRRWALVPGGESSAAAAEFSSTSPVHLRCQAAVHCFLWGFYQIGVYRPAVRKSARSDLGCKLHVSGRLGTPDGRSARKVI